MVILICTAMSIQFAWLCFVVDLADDLQLSYNSIQIGYRYVLMRSILHTWNARDDIARVQLLLSTVLLLLLF